MCGRSVSLLVLMLWGLSGTLCAEEGRSLTVFPGRSVSEEDLPAEEMQPQAPVEPLEAAPFLPRSSAPAVIPEAVPAVPPPVVPPLPTQAVLSPQEQAALRFIEQGRNALGQEEWERAREQFERAVTIAPLQPYGYYFLGRVAFARGEHKQALAFLHKAELLFAQSDQAWLGETASLKGAVYEDLGDYAQARVAYQRCLQLVPAHLKALSALARLSEEESLPSEPLPQ